MADLHAPTTSSPARGVAGGAEYYPAFDWLRGVLAAMVMLYHDRIIPWSHAASFSVEVFFALSGWLIGGVLLHHSRADLPRFFFNRAIRIWVPYFLAFGLLIAASLLKDPITPKWWEFVVYKVTFVYNIFGPPQLAAHGSQMPLGGTGNHFWSVNAEEQFYLLAPLLLVIFAGLGRQVLTWVALAALAWWGQYYAGIVFGVLAAVAVHRVGPLHRGPWARLLLALVVVGSVAVFALNALPYEAVAPFAAIAIVLLLATPGERRPLGALVGGLSYQLYLNHWIGVFVANALLGRFGLRDSPVRQALSVVLALAMAAALYWWVDRRLLTQRQAWFTEARGRGLMVLSYGLVAAGLVFGVAMLSSR